MEENKINVMIKESENKIEKNRIEKKFNVEKEAQSLFGNMREATIAEQKSIQNNIGKISVETGYNFWIDCVIVATDSEMKNK